MHAVHAAGGVPWRPTPTGLQVCLIHRPRYDDWSLPKGKLEPGEHPLAGAVREVLEETGLRGIPQLRLPTVHYTLPGDIAKRVDFWAMRAADTTPVERDGEADAVQWFPIEAAVQRVSYTEDRRVLRHFADQPPVTFTLPLVRHAHAGKRGAFSGPDAVRPLDAAGEREAARLAPLLALFDPHRLVSAAPLRCVQTLQPLAALAGRQIEIDPTFDEPAEPGQTDERARVAAGALTALAAAGTPVVVCSQGKLMPRLLANLAGHGADDDYRTRKGTGWLVAFSRDTVVGLDRLLPDDVFTGSAHDQRAPTRARSASVDGPRRG